jgi:hypothetical protein
MRAVCPSRHVQTVVARLLSFVVIFVFTIRAILVEPDDFLKTVVFHAASFR